MESVSWDHLIETLNSDECCLLDTMIDKFECGKGRFVLNGDDINYVHHRQACHCCVRELLALKIVRWSLD